MIFDTGGESIYKKVQKDWLKNKDTVLLVFNVNDVESFNELY